MFRIFIIAVLVVFQWYQETMSMPLEGLSGTLLVLKEEKTALELYEAEDEELLPILEYSSKHLTIYRGLEPEKDPKVRTKRDAEVDTPLAPSSETSNEVPNEPTPAATEQPPPPPDSTQEGGGAAEEEQSPGAPPPPAEEISTPPSLPTAPGLPSPPSLGAAPELPSPPSLPAAVPSLPSLPEVPELPSPPPLPASFPTPPPLTTSGVCVQDSIPSSGDTTTASPGGSNNSFFGIQVPDFIGEKLGKLGEHGQQIATDVKNAVTGIIGQLSAGISSLAG